MSVVVRGLAMRGVAGAFASLLLLAVASVAAAQSAGGEVGSRVRVSIQPDRLAVGAGEQVLVGRVVAADAEAVEIEIHRQIGPVRVPRGWISAMWISEGRETGLQAARRGFVTGGAIGAGLGAVIGAEVSAATDEDFFRATLLRAAAYGFSIGATTAIYRSMNPGERWLRVAVRPVAGAGSGRGFSVGLTY